MKNERTEIVACAAIRLGSGLIVAGRRHPDILAACLQHRIPAAVFKAGTPGFMTTHGRFVDRLEARNLQTLAGILSADPEGYRGTGLFSEDLY